MNARQLTSHLHGKWYGGYGTAPCPVCQPNTKDRNALTLGDGDNGRLLLNCKKLGCAYRDILVACGISSGDYVPPDAAATAQREVEQKAQVTKRKRQAKSVWNEAQPVGDTIAETYLRGRGITCPLPDTLRFHPECWHATAKRLPAMIARIDCADGFAVHRTYLDTNGSGKASVKPNKAMLGAARGGAVRLLGEHSRLVVAEGIETALSLPCGLLREPATIWAALSTSGISGLHLPPHAGKLTIAADGDSAGQMAAHMLAERATALGWNVCLLPAPNGRDWNDILQMKGAEQ